MDHEKAARDIMDQACLPVSLTTVDHALRQDITAALKAAAEAENEACALKMQGIDNSMLHQDKLAAAIRALKG